MNALRSQFRTQMRNFSISSRKDDMAKLTLIGRLGKDPAVKTTANDKEYVVYTVATRNPAPPPREDGTRREPTTSWHSVLCFNPNANNYLKTLKKGTQVYVEASYELQEADRNASPDSTAGQRQIFLRQVGGFLSKQSTPNPPSVVPDTVRLTPTQDAASVPDAALPAWPTGTMLDLYFYMSTSPSPLDLFSDQPKEEGLPNFIWNDIVLGDWKDNSRSIDYDIVIPHDHATLNPSRPDFDPRSVHYLRKVLTRLLPKVKVRKEKNLLSSSNEFEEDISEEEPDTMALHCYVLGFIWLGHSNLTLTLVSDNPTIPFSKLPPALTQYVKLTPERTPTGQGVYWPVVFPNDFWLLRSQFVEVNFTTPKLPLHITFHPISYMKFQLYASLTAGFEEASKNQQAGSAELDELKRMLTETSPYLLILTAVIRDAGLFFGCQPLAQQKRDDWGFNPHGV
ncbi:hypothetical protein Clacol_001601 [Clathrus columnatus]|uniref:Single-stranded DNA-binding protein n=1 Tax=Clathrus columnatus TaxID=1419009 RepID=A0AAV5A290_9AGAM|nr:hypothetical protein Clacol_001601 [Clathrus columnatus]